MITDERTATYIESLSGGNTPFLEEIEKKALEDGVPVIRRATQSLIRYILASNKPMNILEVGAAVGFSALFMATYGPEGVHITTIENYEKRIKVAKENIANSEYSDNVELICADAMDTLTKLCDEGKCYDMIFIDAAKAQYINYLPLAKNMLRKGGILITDNVLFDGDIVQSRFAVRRRDRTIHARMREFLRTLSDDKDMVTTVLPIGDGMTISVKEV